MSSIIGQQIRDVHLSLLADSLSGWAIVCTRSQLWQLIVALEDGASSVGKNAIANLILTDWNHTDL